MRICKKCNNQKVLIDFTSQKKNGKLYYGHTCKTCSVKDKLILRKKDPERKHKKWVDTRINKLRQIIIEAKNKPCIDCKNQYHFSAMDLDHRNPEEKRFAVSDYRRLSLSEKSLREEIIKCDVLCAVCHRIKTYEHKNNQKIDRAPLRAHRIHTKYQKHQVIDSNDELKENSLL